MAKKNKIDIDKFIETHSSKFGTKMPSNMNKEEALTREQLLQTQMIMGSLGALIWGKQSITRESQIKTLLGNNNTLFNLVNSIKKDISYIKNSGVRTSLTKESVNTLKTNLSEPIVDAIDSLYSSLSSIEGKLDNLQKPGLSDIGELATAISQLDTNQNKQKEVLNSLNTIFSSTEFKEALQKSVESKLIIKFDNPSHELTNIIKLLEGLNNFEGKDTKTISTSLNGLIKLINFLGEEEFDVNTKNVKRNIKLISNILNDNKEGLQSIVNKLKDLKSKEGEINENINFILSSLGEFIGSIIKLGDLDTNNVKNLKRNINYINDYIASTLVDIIKKISDSLKDVNKEFSESIYALNDLIDKLFKMADFSFKDMILLDFKLTYLADIIDRDIIGDKNAKNKSILIALNSVDESTLNHIINTAEKLNELYDILGVIVNNDNFTLKNVTSFLIKLKLISLASDLITENVTLIDFVINQLNNVKPNIKRIKNTLEIIKELLSLKGNVFGARSLRTTLSIIHGSIDLISDICENVKSNIKPDDIKLVKDVIGTFTELMAKSAAILLIAGLVMGYINPVKLLLFTVTLGTFLWGVTKVFSLMSKSIEKDIKVSKEAMMLVAISAGILIFGGLAMNFINPIALFAFAITLGGFMILIATSYLLFNLIKKDVFKSAKDFAYLIMVSTGILILGSLFMLSDLWPRSIAFGLLLIGFIGLVTFAYSLASMIMKPALHTAKDLSILVGISALVLMVGALFMSNPKHIIGAISFALLLSGFIFLIMATIKWASKDIKSALSTMIAISALIVVSALTLLIGGALFAIFPNLFRDVILFGVILAGFIYMVSKICKMLTSSQKDIMQGILLMAGVTMVIALAAIAIGLIAGVAWLVKKVGWGHVIGTVIMMAAIFAGLLFVCKIIGNPEIAGYIAIGIAVLGALTIVLYLMIGALAALVAVVKYASTLPDWETLGNTFLKIGASIYGLVALTPAFVTLSAASLLMAPGIAATFAISAALSSVARTIQMWADLKIPIYDSNGKLIGYKSMSENDLIKASVYIEAVLNTLFGAIKKVYNGENKELFNVDWNTLLTGKNPIQRVISSSMQLGKMLASIAYGIKAWAKLTIPEYDSKGKLIGYKTIDNSAFRDAADNIKAVITCLGQAIIDVYKEAPKEMFETKEWFGLGNSPFAKVTKALKTMGLMLSSIASGVKAWVDLKIPIYKDKSTKVSGYLHLTAPQFKKAQNNIINVVKCLGNAIIEMYKKAPKGMFDDKSWHGFGDTTFARVVKSLNVMGKALNNIATAVQSWANLKIPIYGDKKDGTKITGYQTINNDIFKKVAKNIRFVVTTLARSIASLVKDNEYSKLFTETNHWWELDTPVVKVLKSIRPIGSSLKDISDALVAWASMKVPVYGDPNNPTKVTGYDPMPDIDTAQDHIKKVIKGLIEGVGNAWDEDLFDEGGFLGWFKHDSKIAQVLGALQPLGNTLSTIATTLKAWSELRIPIYDKKSLKPTRYISLSENEGIDLATDMITKVIRALIKGVAYAYYGKLFIKGSNKTVNYEDLFKGKLINNIADSISKISNVIANIAKGISDIAMLKIPEYGNNGKPIRYHNIKNGDFEKISVVITDILTAIGRALVNVATDPLLNPNKNPAFGMAVDVIKHSTDILSSIADVIGNYATGKFVVYKVQRGKLIPEKVIDINNKNIQSNIQKNIITVLTTLGDAIALMVGSGSNNKLKYATSHNEKQISILKSVVVTLANNIGEIFEELTKLNNAAKENKEAINALISPPKGQKKLAELLKESIEELNNIASQFNEATKTNLQNVSKNSEKLKKDIQNTYSVINEALIKLSKLANANFKVEQADFNYISSTITKFTTALSDINKSVKKIVLSKDAKSNIKSLIEDSSQLVTLLNNFVKIIEASKKITNKDYENLRVGMLSLFYTISSIKVDTTIFLNYSSFIDLLEDYVKLINSIDPDIFDDKVNSLKDGILNINSIIKQIENTKTFAQHIETLKKYIETINGVELDKLNKMQNFVDSMNKLSQNLGNLDNLTDAIANRLSSVLFELVNQLTQADKSISNAHKLQDERKKLIEESVSKIENLMSQHMIVEISQMTDEDKKQQSPQTPNGSIDGTPVNTSAAQGDDTTVQSNGTKLESPDTAQATTTPGLSQNSNGLTYWQFRQYMEEEFAKKFKGDLKNDITGQ